MIMGYLEAINMTDTTDLKAEYEHHNLWSINNLVRQPLFLIMIF